MTPASASVLVIDDHPIVMQGCRRVLQDIGVQTLHEARSVACGYRSFLRLRPDVVVLDLTFEDDDLGGLALVRRIARSDRSARILVFSMHNDSSVIARALEEGALSYVLKDHSSLDFANAFKTVLRGEPYLSHTLAMQVAMSRAKGRVSGTDGLTEREAEMLSLLGRGKSYDDIATRLGISYKTVTNALSVIRTKLKIASLAELIKFAIGNGPDRIA